MYAAKHDGNGLQRFHSALMKDQFWMTEVWLGWQRRGCSGALDSLRQQQEAATAAAVHVVSFILDSLWFPHTKGVKSHQDGVWTCFNIKLHVSSDRFLGACSHQESLVCFRWSGPKCNVYFLVCCGSFSHCSFHKSLRIWQQTHMCAYIIIQSMIGPNRLGVGLT